MQLQLELQKYYEGVMSDDLQTQSAYTMSFRKLLSKGGNVGRRVGELLRWCGRGCGNE